MVKIGTYEFSHIATIQPERAPDGQILSHYPHRQIKSDLPLLPYGEGPFCRFRIGDDIQVSGVYAVTLERRIVCYIGETINLSQRYNRGYGFIQSRACYQGGQATNLRINHFIYHAISANLVVDLWFYNTVAYKAVEAELIAQIKPKWNRRGLAGAWNTSNISQPAKVSQSQATPPKARTSTCRLEILECMREMMLQTGKTAFTVAEIIHAMEASGTTYKRVTIQLHVTSKMCLAGPAIHPTRYDDLQKVNGNLYELKKKPV